LLQLPALVMRMATLLLLRLLLLLLLLLVGILLIVVKGRVHGGLWTEQRERNE